jgi:hypothetical protein
MLDNQLITLLISTIIAGEADAGIAGSPIQQAFQPTQQGVPKTASAFMYKVGDIALGSPQRSDTWTDPMIVHVETQDYETTFQISALSIQSPTNQSQYTASDILNLIRSILQSSNTIATLAAQGVGMLRVHEIRNVPFSDDFGRNEYSPSLDFIVQHKQITTSTAPIVSEVEIILDRV